MLCYFWWYGKKSNSSATDSHRWTQIGLNTQVTVHGSEVQSSRLNTPSCHCKARTGRKQDCTELKSNMLIHLTPKHTTCCMSRSRPWSRFPAVSETPPSACGGGWSGRRTRPGRAEDASDGSYPNTTYGSIRSQVDKH